MKKNGMSSLQEAGVVFAVYCTSTCVYFVWPYRRQFSFRSEPLSV